MKGIDWKTKLSSRKLWITIAEFVVMLLIARGAEPESAMQLGALIIAGATPIAYILGESWIDSNRENITKLPDSIEVDRYD